MTDSTFKPRLIGPCLGPVVVLAGLAAVFHWFGRLTAGGGLFLLLTACWMLCRAVLTRAAPPPVVQSRVTGLEKALLQGVGIGMMALPLLTVATPVRQFADYPEWSGILAIGCGFALIGLWVFWRSHVDIGRNWSMTLELRQEHSLITTGIYRHVRHPMYVAIFLMVLAQAAFVANWIGGPAGVISFGVLYALRIGPEERMMQAQFGDAWHVYAARTGRLVPRLCK